MLVLTGMYSFLRHTLLCFLIRCGDGMLLRTSGRCLVSSTTTTLTPGFGRFFSIPINRTTGCFKSKLLPAYKSPFLCHRACGSTFGQSNRLYRVGRFNGPAVSWPQRGDGDLIMGTSNPEVVVEPVVERRQRWTTRIDEVIIPYGSIGSQRPVQTIPIIKRWYGVRGKVQIMKFATLQLITSDRHVLKLQGPECCLYAHYNASQVLLHEVKTIDED